MNIETGIKHPLIDNIENTEVKPSKIHGYGLFALCDIPKGVILCTLDGQKVSWDHHRAWPVCQEWNALPNDHILARPYQTKYFAINHSREPNLRLASIHPISTLYVTIDINIGDEILLDYREQPLPKSYLEGHGKTYL